MSQEIFSFLNIAVATTIVVVFIYSKISNSRKQDILLKKEEVGSKLHEKQHNAAIEFIERMTEEYKEMRKKLEETEKEKIEYVQKIAELTVEINLLRNTVEEIKAMLRKLTTELEQAKNEIIERERRIVGLEMENKILLEKIRDCTILAERKDERKSKQST